MCRIHHHQGPVLRAPLAGVAGDGIGVVHRLDPSQVQVHGSAGPFQFDPGLARLPVQGPDDGGVTIGDPESLSLDPAAFRFLGLPVLDPVAHGEPPGLNPGHVAPLEAAGGVFHLAAVLQDHPESLSARIH